MSIRLVTDYIMRNTTSIINCLQLASMRCPWIVRLNIDIVFRLCDHLIIFFLEWSIICRWVKAYIISFISWKRFNLNLTSIQFSFIIYHLICEFCCSDRPFTSCHALIRRRWPSIPMNINVFAWVLLKELYKSSIWIDSTICNGRLLKSLNWSKIKI
jgi:hypothetical protein